MIGEILFPAEWHPQSGVQLTWPHKDTDWADMLDEVQACFVELACEISQRERLLIVAPCVKEVKEQLSGRANEESITYFECATNDTWARDHAAMTVFKCGVPQLIDFKFNGWGLKFASNLDNQINAKIAQDGNVLNGIYQNQLNFVLEGGSVESDGFGTILTTSECLLSPNRNGASTKEEIEQHLKDTLGAQQVLWLDHGYLAGDDTDSHIDTLARLCPNNTIAYVACKDFNDEHFGALHAMREQLEGFRTLSGKPYRLLALPMADPIYEDGERLPATYANFLVMNDAVLYPTYRQSENDQKAAEVLAKAFPDHEIVGVDCVALIKQHGSLHCVTMQYPEQVLL